MIRAYVSLILLTILLFVGGVFLLSKSGRDEAYLMSRVKFYQKTDSAKPALTILGDKSLDLGEISVKSEKSTTFKIKNTGSAILQIYSGTSSCNCTFGQVASRSTKSPVFAMHDPRKFLVELFPGEEGTVSVIYRPYLMPSPGKNIRVVTIKTNDPVSPEAEFIIEVLVTE